eukprot:sb/3464404/
MNEAVAIHLSPDARVPFVRTPGLLSSRLVLVESSLYLTGGFNGTVHSSVLSLDSSLSICLSITVRPHIEYCVQVWNPPAAHGYWKLILKLEDVQRSFTRLIDGIGLLPYSERLRILQLTTLLERRMRGDLIETFKITSGKVDYGKDLFRVSRSGTKILKDGRGDGVLSNRVANYWNKIPANVKEASSVDTFKARLEQYKTSTIASGSPSLGHFWELSEILISKINNRCNHDLYADCTVRRGCSWSTTLDRCIAATHLDWYCTFHRCDLRIAPQQCPRNCSHYIACTTCSEESHCVWREGRCERGNLYQISTTPHYFTCPPESECELEVHTCRHDQVCQDTEKGYNCTCPPGTIDVPSKDRCVPYCDSCYQGECIAHNKCRCFFGYYGPDCSRQCRCNGNSECTDDGRCVKCQHNTQGSLHEASLVPTQETSYRPISYSLIRSCYWLSANQGPVFLVSVGSCIKPSTTEQ